MNTYNKKVLEAKLARNNSKTALKSRGIKWTKTQQNLIRVMSADKDTPTREKILNLFPNMSNEKVDAMIAKIKKDRKKLANNLNLIDSINGIRNSKGKGYVYLIENELFFGWIKCGMTTNLIKRLNNYNINDPLKRYKFLINKEVIDRRKSEMNLLREMQIKSTLNNGEWFRIDKNKAIEIFQTV